MMKRFFRQDDVQQGGFYSLNLSTYKMTALAMVLMVSLVGCQSTTPDMLIERDYNPLSSSNDAYNSKNEIAKVRTALAAQYIRENDLDAAKRQLEKAFIANSRYAPAYDMMGVLLQQEGSSANLQKADAYFQRAIAIDNNFMQAHNNYGVYLSQMNRYHDAIKQFEIAGSALGYEGRIGALENLGRVYLKVHNEASATKAFIRALEGNRNSIIAHVELVDLFIKQNRVQQATQLYDETLMLIKGQATSPRILLQGVKLANAQGQASRRQQLSRELLSAYPLSDEAKLLKSWLKNPKAATAWK